MTATYDGPDLRGLLAEVLAKEERLAATGEPDLETNWTCGLCGLDTFTGGVRMYTQKVVLEARPNGRDSIDYVGRMFCPCCSRDCEHQAENRALQAAGARRAAEGRLREAQRLRAEADRLEATA